MIDCDVNCTTVVGICCVVKQLWADYLLFLKVDAASRALKVCCFVGVFRFDTFVKLC